MARSRLRSENIERRGTRFLLYPQPPILSSVTGPELVWVSPAAGTIGPGPSDGRMYVVDAIDKTPYEYPYLPPHRGARHPPVAPGPDGHFDHLTDVRSREFMAAHMYGTLRFVLDVWEKYFGRPLPWHFDDVLPRLELVPLVQWDNAHSGYGFIETGFARARGSKPLPFCLNFDVLAHELGHSFVYELLGTPPAESAGSTYFAFQESAADCVALVAAMHFDSVVDRLLERTSGNIYLPNELNRIGEISETQEIRLASQSLRLADVPDQRTPVDSLSQPERHAMSLPLTGAIFDVFVDVFQLILVREGLITPALDALSRPDVNAADERAVQSGFDRAYAGRHDEFKSAFAEARDYMGRVLANAWGRLSWDVTYGEVAAALLMADGWVADGAGYDIVQESLAWRGIRVPFRGGRSSFSERVLRAGALAAPRPFIRWT